MRYLKGNAAGFWLIGIGLLLSLLLGSTATVANIEARLFLQLVEFAPVSEWVQLEQPPELSGILHKLLTFINFGLLGVMLSVGLKPRLFLAGLILPVFLLWLVQVLLAIMFNAWLPVFWPSLTFLVFGMILIVGMSFSQVRNLFAPMPECDIEDIKKRIDSKEFTKAILMLKHCPFSDEMFELSYELGLKLEGQKKWLLARHLYEWLVQFDPGMQDFVERIEEIINPEMGVDLAMRDITEPGARFGHYQLLGKKAKGATAVVYEALDKLTEKPVALKVLNQRMDDSSGEKDVMSFLHEAMTISKLDHPNIVKIHDADIIDEQAYIAMEYVPGYPMSERLRRKKLLTVGECLRILRSMLQALEFAHQHGIVHGDIKPANILFDQARNQYVLTDFGAAFNHQHSFESSRTITGTPAYMSPEQLSGSRLDGRSDLFSLAVTACHLLSGKQLFVGSGLPELKKSVLTDEVDLSSLSIPDNLRMVLLKTLQKKPYQRFADASQMLRSVERCEQQLAAKG